VKKKVFVLLGLHFLPNQFKSVTHYLNNVIVEVRLEVIVLTAKHTVGLREAGK